MKRACIIDTQWIFQFSRVLRLKLAYVFGHRSREIAGESPYRMAWYAKKPIRISWT
jgi:hypothetical protein